MDKLIKIFAHLKQPSTIKGIMVIAGLVGLGIPPELAPIATEVLQGISTTLIGLVAGNEVIRNELKDKK